MVQVFIVGNNFFYFGIGLINILRIAGKRHPAEGTNAATEQWTNIGGYKAREIKGIFHAHLFGHLANVITVIKRRHTHFAKVQHCLYVCGHGTFRRLHRTLRIGYRFCLVLFPAPAGRQITV
ncbi:hypothetical protein D3C73_1304960 [compost metagenome]